MDKEPDYIVLFLYFVLLLLFAAVVIQGLETIAITQIVYHYPIP